MRDAIQIAPTAHEAKMHARRQAQAVRPDWDQVKEDVMRTTLAAKFRAHLLPRTVLLATDARPIAETSPHDSYWGLGPDGRGHNRLGHLLMELRARLKKS